MPKNSRSTPAQAELDRRAALGAPRHSTEPSETHALAGSTELEALLRRVLNSIAPETLSKDLEKGLELQIGGRCLRVVPEEDGRLEVTDITTQWKARKAQEHLDWLLDDVGRALGLSFFIKSSNYAFEYWSPGLQEFSGIKHSEIVGQPGSNVFPEEHLILYQRMDHEVLTTKSLVVTDEPLMTRHGELWIHTQKVPLFYLDDVPSHVLGICEDISHRRHLESERGRLFEEISSAITQRDRMMAAVAHDLGNPLAVLSLTTSAMRKLEPGPKSIDRFVDRISHAARQMTAVASDLKLDALVRDGRLRLDSRPHEPLALIDQALELDRALADDRGVSLRADAVISPLPAVLGDNARIARVFTNLISNAIDFTPEGGRITLRAREVGAMVRFEVSDTGPGIEREHLPHLFEPYWQASPGCGRGTGLGLGIAKGNRGSPWRNHRRRERTRPWVDVLFHLAPRGRTDRSLVVAEREAEHPRPKPISITRIPPAEAAL